MSHGFQTLEHFSRLVRASQVTMGEGGVMSLEEGMERALQTFELIKARQKKVLLIGNGGSAAVASHQAVDLWRNAGMRALAFSDASMLTCIANDFGYQDVYSQPIDMLCDPGDCLIAISSSGKSTNILQAVDKARAKGAGVISFSGFSRENELRSRGDLNFYLPSTSYGIVEVGHLLLLHSIIDEFVQRTKKPSHDTRIPNRPFSTDAAHT